MLATLFRPCTAREAPCCFPFPQMEIGVLLRHVPLGAPMENALKRLRSDTLYTNAAHNHRLFLIRSLLFRFVLFILVRELSHHCWGSLSLLAPGKLIQIGPCCAGRDETVTGSIRLQARFTTKINSNSRKEQLCGCVNVSRGKRGPRSKTSYWIATGPHCSLRQHVGI